MRMNKRSSLINWMMSFATVLIAVIVIGLCFDYFYDLNDDVLIKDILSGAYTGTPSGHCIQSYFLLGFPLSLLYRIAPSVPWYGGMLVLFQYGSLFLIVARSLRIFAGRTFKTLGRELVVKGLVSCVETAFFVFLVFEHLINIQYTVTVAMMAGAVVVWILTVEDTEKPFDFIRKCFPAIIIVFVAFLLRSEMLLLMLPFIGLAGLFKWSYEKKFFTRTNVAKYLGTFGIMLLFLAVAFLSDKIAYSSSDWKVFGDFFDARTELYDFQTIPSYEENEAFYESEGLMPEEQLLLENYNFGIDEKIDGPLLWRTAEYSKKQGNTDYPFVTRLKDNLKLYIYQAFHGKNSAGSDYPWNIIILMMYLLVICNIVSGRDYIGLWRVVLLVAGRSAIRMYILMGNRTPDRIMHSLFFIEAVLLFGMLVTRLSYKYILLPQTIFILMMVTLLIDRPAELAENQNYRNEVNSSYYELLEYVGNASDAFYLIDVYSTVAYSEKIFDNNPSKVNFELMGGWACNSPLMKDKLTSFGLKDMESALLGDSVYFITDNERETDWLTDYYDAKDMDIALSKTNTIGGKFDIYAITRK